MTQYIETGKYILGLLGQVSRIAGGGGIQRISKGADPHDKKKDWK